MPRAMSKYHNSAKADDWYACPSCGDEVRVGSSGCPRCRDMPDVEDDATYLDGVDLPGEEEFDHAAWAKKEFGASSKIKPPHLAWHWWIAGILLVAAMIAAAGFARL